MNSKYKMMLEPYVLPNGVVLKSRITSGPAILSYGQANEPFPNQEMMMANISKAKSGAAIVPVHCCDPLMRREFNYRTGMIQEHGANWNMYDHRCQHVIGNMVQGIHDYGAKALSIQYFDPFIMAEGPYDVSTGIETPWVYGDNTEPRYDMVECPKEIMDKAMDEIVEACYVLKHDMGFDGLWTGAAYRHTFLGRLLSPLTNKRSDEYGGNLENRSRYLLDCFRKIKETCGYDFIIEVSISGHDPLDEEGGFTIEEACQFAKMAEGLIDILMIKGPTIDETHPTQFDEETPYLYMAEAVKASNPKLAVETISGFVNPDTVEAALESNKADIVAMTRTWISNMDYVNCIREDRVDDIVPCIKCNKCHRTSDADPWVSDCSVNPVYGSATLLEMITPATKKKKVAVIGGGPAGLEAARVCFDRGHDVTVYEKSSKLGGLINVVEDVPFKWPLKDFRDYLIHQVEKRDITVCLNSAPSIDQLKREKFDHVLVAVGSSPLVIPVEGIDGKNVVTALDAFKCYDDLDDEIVIIGGGEIGVETGMYLSDQGKNVTVLEMTDKPARDSTPIHYYIMFKHAWEACDNLEILCNAKVTRVSDNGVYYTDKDGQEQFIKCGNVVLAAGMQSNMREALKYYGGSYGFDIIGDCKRVGNVQTLMRSAYYTANMI